MIAEPGWCPGDELALCLFTDAVLVPWPSLAVIKYAVCCKEIEHEQLALCLFIPIHSHLNHLNVSLV